MTTLLDDAELSEALSTLTDWHGDRNAISRTIRIPGSEIDAFLESLEMVAREMNHDPDTSLTDGSLTITMSTHSAGGVTHLDVDYARRVDAMLS